ncbi:MAG: hypothetical protein ACRDZT_00540 [Acidimicrobiales bacterium]
MPTPSQNSNEHEHEHEHEDMHEPEHSARPIEPSQAVFIDVDDSHGALVLGSEAAREGLQVEIHPAGRPDLRTHVWVLPRSAGGKVTYAAVFSCLDAGSYQVLEPDGSPGATLQVPPGEVTTASWA